MELSNKHALVVGLGVTGAAVASFLKKNGSKVTVTDSSSEQQLRERIAKLREEDIRMEIGRHSMETFDSADLIVLSPGVPHTIPPVKHARDKGIPVMGEIELASRFIKEPIVAVTGTNGKTTTTALLGEILQTSGFKTFVGGNIGNPLIDYVNQNVSADIVVVEISSFQLDTIETFRPDVAVLLNITADHLDRYTDFDAYISSKGLIFKNQMATDTAVLNGSDPHVLSLVDRVRSRKLFFSNPTGTAINMKTGALIGNNEIIFHSTKTGRRSLPHETIGLFGRHNLENVAAASLAAQAAGAPFEGVVSALKSFKGLPHRLECVATKNNVKYFNDSKATNLDSVARAVESFTAPIVLIMGGRDKGSDFSILKNLLHRHVKLLIAMGEAKEKIISALGSAVPSTAVDTMQDAVSKASGVAAPGEVVLLSPGCASFDSYKNYAERGKDFTDTAKRI